MKFKTNQQSAKWLLILVAGGLLGVLFSFGFTTAMHMTSTTEFCVSCHEMQQPWENFQATAHYENRHGFEVGCKDCHIPKETIPKLVRKVQAAREVWGHWTGIIDTPEKYAAHQPVMKERELSRMRANDSQECRNCHQPERMIQEQQTTAARKAHSTLKEAGKTCIDCHQGIAHDDPVAEEEMNFEL